MLAIVIALIAWEHSAADGHRTSSLIAQRKRLGASLIVIKNLKRIVLPGCEAGKGQGSIFYPRFRIRDRIQHPIEVRVPGTDHRGVWIHRGQAPPARHFSRISPGLYNKFNSWKKSL